MAREESARFAWALWWMAEPLGSKSDDVAVMNQGREKFQAASEGLGARMAIAFASPKAPEHRDEQIGLSQTHDRGAHWPI